MQDLGLDAIVVRLKGRLLTLGFADWHRGLGGGRRVMRAECVVGGDESKFGRISNHSDGRGRQSRKSSGGMKTPKWLRRGMFMTSMYSSSSIAIWQLR